MYSSSNFSIENDGYFLQNSMIVLSFMVTFITNECLLFIAFYVFYILKIRNIVVVCNNHSFISSILSTVALHTRSLLQYDSQHISLNINPTHFSRFP
jgi:hypothetical protein